MAKLTDEEIKKINDLKVGYTQLVETLGSIEVQLITFTTKKEQLKVDLLKIQDDELKIAKELEDKYGQGTISLETGEFSPNE
jgi:stress response protein YsnF